MQQPAEFSDFAGILGAVPMPVVVYDRELRFAYSNAAFLKSVHRAWEELAGRFVGDVFPESEERMSMMRARMMAALDGQSGGYAELPYHLPGPDGAPQERYWRSTMQPLFAPDGSVTHIVQSGEDVTEQTLLRQQRDVIASELEHRVRNTLAMAGSLAMIIGQNTPSVEAFVESFTDRLDAMGRNLAMIADHDWQGLPLRAVIEAELAQAVAPGDPRVQVTGPDLMLTMRSGRWGAMLAHELVKNAVRHGCFSVPGGSLRVSWTLEGETLTADWVETGRKHTGEPQRRGFGSQMLDLMPEVSVDRVFHEGGMSVRIRARSSTFRLIEPDQRPPETLK
ncbi:MAG: PAS domain-containing protein [Acidobacteria bacterium]|nr:PAS domain-containing protein [Acidobacteriota bacterium]